MSKKILTIIIALILVVLTIYLFNIKRPWSSLTKIQQPSKTANENNNKINSGTILKDITYKTVNNEEIKLDIYAPTKYKYKKSPVIIYIHGGGWSYGDKALDNNVSPIIDKIREEGLFIISINYRLTSKSIKFPSPVEDCKDAIRWVYKHAENYNFDKNNIGLWGVSAGAHLALLCAYTSNKDFIGDEALSTCDTKVKYVIDFFGPTSLSLQTTKDGRAMVESLINTNSREVEDLLKKASPLTYITPSAPPTLIVHGEKDTLVPILQSKLLYDKGRELGVKIDFLSIPKAEHNLANAQYIDLFKILNSTLNFIKDNT
ncbi:alpha/beta hydrolase [Desnuesiella massiliensis]|uniref:alpha/beta hydrolase n=1 Tax=Desnuesiella massiliensis TaxID=1650662 RepID=UPI0006E2F56E|nr:alpha/beta hydrolase [Desnuesiella massiliensis]